MITCWTTTSSFPLPSYKRCIRITSSLERLQSPSYIILKRISSTTKRCMFVNSSHSLYIIHRFLSKKQTELSSIVKMPQPWLQLFKRTANSYFSGLKSSKKSNFMLVCYLSKVMFSSKRRMLFVSLFRHIYSTLKVQGLYSLFFANKLYSTCEILSFSGVPSSFTIISGIILLHPGFLSQMSANSTRLKSDYSKGSCLIVSAKQSIKSLSSVFCHLNFSKQILHPLKKRASPRV